MKNKLLILSIICLFSFSCKSQQAPNNKLYFDSEKFIAFDTTFVKDLRPILLESKKNVLLKEKDAFINRKIDNEKYLKKLDLSIKYYLQVDDEFNQKLFKSIIGKRKKNINVKNIYFIDVFLSGDEFSNLQFLLIENFDGNIELFDSRGNYKNLFNSGIIEFTNEFMLNLPYSFENKTPNLDGHFTIYKIAAIGANKYEVSSAIATEILNYQLLIIKEMYEVNNKLKNK